MDLKLFVYSLKMCWVFLVYVCVYVLLLNWGFFWCMTHILTVIPCIYFSSWLNNRFM